MTKDTAETKDPIKMIAEDGKPIVKGDVLINVQDGVRGVVTWVGLPGATNGPMFSGLGDIAVRRDSSLTRVSNQYSHWRHVEHDDQTYAERFLSWIHVPYVHDHHDNFSEEAGMVMHGIMALLPSDSVDWTYGPTPDTPENVLQLLTDHLTKLQAAASIPKPTRTHAQIINDQLDRVERAHIAALQLLRALRVAEVSGEESSLLRSSPVVQQVPESESSGGCAQEGNGS